MPPPVLGVDACRAGWIGALLHDGRVRVLVAADIAALVAAAGIDVVGVDIPIGLPDAGRRTSDALARSRLRGRGSTVFPTLARAAFEAPTYAEARAASLAATGLSASAQSYALRAKVLDVDGFVRSRPGVTVLEVHPELSFTTMSGLRLPPKKSAAGARARRAALRAADVAPPAYRRGGGYGVDDLLDACAVAWTARRHATGRAESLPAEPEVFSDGIPAAIWV
ncbi:DUF429 domain-containing protein [Nocardioides mangrovicus]|uniref:DUF429 domain-containing protein n=1 Tax=Nocardioides mangrovicus TaxID=2478913 RepID=UPI001314F127|nr:DUF429 domain-containing protein [Nocardioides mangrovicus]